MKKRIGLFSSLILAILLCATMSGCLFIRNFGNISDLPDSNGAAGNVTLETWGSELNGGRTELSIVDAVAKVERSSVAIYMIGDGTVGTGSGVIIDTSGFNVQDAQIESNCVYIITCFHVISSTGIINVLLPDLNSSYENEDFIFGGVVGNSKFVSPIYYKDSRKMETAVTLVGGDRLSDIAVLRLDLGKKALSGKTLGQDKICKAKVPPTTYSLKRGETIFAVGNPTGSLPGTVSVGNVGYLNREVSVENIGKMQLMQISLATNPGNSGGGLYNLYGELVGITNAGNTNYDEINFAIPMKTSEIQTQDKGFIWVASQLIYTKTNVNYGYITGRKQTLGFTVTNATDNGENYILVASVVSGSEAAKGGMQANDIVVAISVNNVKKDLNSYEEFVSAMDSLQVNDKVILTLHRPKFLGYDTIEVEFTMEQYIFCDTGIYPSV